MLPTVFRDMPAGDFAFCVRVFIADGEAVAARVRHARGLQPVIDLGDG